MATILIGRTLSSTTDSITAVQGAPGATPWPVLDQSKLVPAAFDTITGLTYDGSGNLTTAVYKLSGITVATLTLTYDVNSNLLSVTRS